MNQHRYYHPADGSMCFSNMLLDRFLNGPTDTRWGLCPNCARWGYEATDEEVVTDLRAQGHEVVVEDGSFHVIWNFPGKRS